MHNESEGSIFVVFDCRVAKLKKKKIIWADFNLQKHFWQFPFTDYYEKPKRIDELEVCQNYFKKFKMAGF